MKIEITISASAEDARRKIQDLESKADLSKFAPLLKRVHFVFPSSGMAEVYRAFVEREKERANHEYIDNSGINAQQ